MMMNFLNNKSTALLNLIDHHQPGKVCTTLITTHALTTSSFKLKLLKAHQTHRINHQTTSMDPLITQVVYQYLLCKIVFLKSRCKELKYTTLQTLIMIEPRRKRILNNNREWIVHKLLEQKGLFTMNFMIDSKISQIPLLAQQIRSPQIRPGMFLN